ncbi:MAG: GIY-YIG nuclease family protein [candidate division Zixibacteria bacterium]|nr:GIY-YIG nuclease family protein [candidate division Zixibacteria bacterium]
MTNAKNPWYVYMLRCSDDSFYTGITKNVTERLKKHNTGNGAKYTKGRRPVTLVYCERRTSRSSAQKREAQIKKWRRPNKEKLIRSFPGFV